MKSKNKKLYPVFGIISVLNTPFTKDDRIDIPGLKRNVEAAIQAGVAGFLVPALASEVYKLSIRERRDIVEAVMEQTNSRVPVIGGAGEMDRDQRNKIVEELISLECKNILLQIPFENVRQFKQDLFRIAEFDLEMIMLQDWDPTGYGLPSSLVCELFEEVESFRCLKIEVVPAGVKYSEMLKATDGRLHVSGGWAVQQMIEALERGVHAFMPTGMHEIYTTIYSLYKSGNVKEAQELFDELLPVLAFSNQHLDISIHFFKRLLYRQGIYSTPRVRQPILPFDEVHERIANRLLDRVLEIIKKVRDD